MKKSIFIYALAMGLTTVSCDDYLDINQDPNSPTEDVISAGMVLPAAEMHLAQSYGDEMRIWGGYFSQQYAHQFGVSNYIAISQYTMTATRSSNVYGQLSSRCQNNLKIVRELSAASEDWGTYLAATTLRAFTYQVLVDAYGEIPYTEALDPSNVTPHYDEGLTVYNGLIAELDEALGRVASTDPVATNFLYAGENAENWIKFANAVKLKILMRMSNVQDVKDQVAALIAENNFPTEDVQWSSCWSNSAGAYSPLYGEDFAPGMQQNLILNLALEATMAAYEDARLGVYFSTNGNGEYAGGVSGTNFSTSANYKSDYWCRPNVAYNTPVSLISVAEVEFFLAEYEARYGSDAQAKAHYENAINASFAAAGVEGAAAAIAAYPWNKNDYKRIIGIQKWIALSGINNYEAWCEVRRLGYPAFGTVTGKQIYDEANDAYNPSIYVPGTLYTPIDYETQVGAGKMIQRIPYAESSANRNNNAPAQKGNSTPIFWAK